MSKKVVVIGGGIIGLCTAYYLQKEGCEITVIDKSNFTSGASHVNAGLITPSHIIPLAAPGMINKGLKWMFNRSSPLYVKPRLDFDFLQWTWLFKKSATAKKVAKSIPVIRDINLLSRELYEEMKLSSDFNFHYQHKGLLMLYKTDKAGEEEWGIGKKALENGLEVEHLSEVDVKKLEPSANLTIKGAVYYHTDAHMTPNEFIAQIKSYLLHKGVAFLPEREVLEFHKVSNKVTFVSTNKEVVDCDDVVVATGTWTQDLIRKLAINIPIQAGKGYRIDTKEPINISIPSILVEAKVAVTPMNGFTRFAGTMEIGGINHNINRKRVDTIAKASCNYYPGLQITEEEKQKAKCGLRPCSPDGLPYIGRLPTIKNVTVATGHAMMGWSLGPATGKLLSEIITDKKRSLDITPFKVERFS